MMQNEKTAGGNGGSSEGTSIESSGQSQFTTNPTPNQPPQNIFEVAAAQAGTITLRQRATLDRMRWQLGSDAYNEFREQAGIRPWTANYRLSKQAAQRLISLILEAGRDE